MKKTTATRLVVVTGVTLMASAWIGIPRVFDYLRSGQPGLRVVDSGAREGIKESKPPDLVLHTTGTEGRTRWSPLDDVGPNRRCNQDSMNYLQNECPIASDPSNLDVLLVGANENANGTLRTGFYCSADAGTTWRHGFYGVGPDVANCSQAYDPAVAIDANGRMFAAYFVNGCEWPNDGAYVHYSNDDGATWSEAITVATVVQVQSQIDRPLITCDVSPDSPYQNNLYAVWLGVHVRFTRSVDGGETFSQPIIISSRSDAIMPCLATGPLGEIYGVWIDLEPEQLRFRKSLDGGLTWQPELTLANCDANLLYNDQNCSSGYRMTNYPVPAVDISHSPYRGTVYIAWSSSTEAGNYNIYLTKSVNGGSTWSAPLLLNDDNTTRHQWWPWIAVHPITGDVAVSWCDRREDPQNCDFAYYGTISTDGGETWCPSIRITDRQLDTQGRGFLGDYTGLTASNLGFHAAWPDTRNDAADIYASWWNNGDSLALGSPNGGELWSVQRQCTTRWNYRYAPDTLLVELNRNYPTGAWERLDTIRSMDREWIWQPTAPATVNARLRIIGLNVPEVGDTSDANFEISTLIAPQQLTITPITPHVQLRWQSTDASLYRVYSSIFAVDSFDTYEGVTPDTVFVDSNAVLGSNKKFYIVRAVAGP